MKIKLIIILCFIFHISTELAAQVTIGAEKAPEKGALLELYGTKKGLQLPRVKLVSLTRLEPQGVTGTWNTTKHTGLWVYNMADDNSEICEGPYIWDGAKWNRLWGSCAGASICEYQITGSNSVVYNVYCADEMDIAHVSALTAPTDTPMENVLDTETYTYHLMTAQEFIQIWEKNRDGTTTKAFGAGEVFFVRIPGGVDDPDGWITTAKKSADGLSAQIAGYGTVAANGVLTKLFPGGTPIGGEYSTATVRGIRN